METIVTHGDVKILQIFSIDEPVKYHRTKTVGYHTGVDIECKEVYSGFPSTIVYIGTAPDNTITVIAQYNADNAFAYMNLKSTDLEPGQFVDTDGYIGEVDQYVHVEYLNTESSTFSVKLVDQMFYKHDPLDILINGYDSFIDYTTQVAVSQNFLATVSEDTDGD